ncbi:MAG: Asp-tRNA(Asn)/Glu-tRNA(Gln) amidotransferase GatCAB subunit C [Candidatus Thermofonsia Clade 1 bacterium]|jgi:aspartyl-tRNA(Asn)/glutamyl-tRNA(Gln) amidotransferase subunit C|uniref:Aspartyl/glutamyl-tRNA(Asn/Gln) amidotransferase subunit C n=1 Tax=Candidatus Thermofonsia Clade 1 bacterium TaxID=2364210 RepID=A0A2M8PBR2_9CHLR|nr:MAG: Asp-tRNA(Asn)/Glu-tRNA(Gln) amidotransferase GatCAB subunit C [Candidatus Thermofonsia Clade 1 bacterium]RMF50618.1 MAG: Asp-tRNA(Asn)/Glu-tRNA(Gln) amidotransferase subunit GatC [Chloroflexota bacterium]
MKLSREEVMQIAELAKLRLTESELTAYAEQLSAVLEYASRLEQLDTADIPPTASVLPLQNVFRDDVVRPSLPRERALANAADAIEGQFRVDAVLE